MKIFSRPSPTAPTAHLCHQLRPLYLCHSDLKEQTWGSCSNVDSASAGGAELLSSELELMLITHLEQVGADCMQNKNRLSGLGQHFSICAVRQHPWGAFNHPRLQPRLLKSESLEKEPRQQHF